MRPRSFLTSGKNTLVTSISPQRFTSAICLNSSIVCHSIGPTFAMPALFIRPHKPLFSGKCCATNLYVFLISSESVTSKCKADSLLLHAAVRFSFPSLVRHVANTLNPRLSSRNAVSLPNPESQPVTKTYFSRKSVKNVSL